MFDFLVVGTTTTVDVSDMLTGVQSGLMSQIGAALPIAGVVFGAVAGILIGIKLFKKITGART